MRWTNRQSCLQTRVATNLNMDFVNDTAGQLLGVTRNKKNPLFREALEQTGNCIDLNFDVEGNASVHSSEIV